MTRYEIIIYWNQADEAFVAEVPELPGCAAVRFCPPVPLRTSFPG